MADVKENQMSKVSDSAYIRGIDGNGNSVLISKNDLLPVVGGTIKKGIVDRNKTFLYDYYDTTAVVYRALTFITDITVGQYMAILLDIKDILTWNYIGNLKIVVKVIVMNNALVRMNLINNATAGLIESIYAYFNAENKLCFTINFKGGVNISNGTIVANCSCHQTANPPDFSNRIVYQGETEMYIADTYSNQIGVIL